MPPADIEAPLPLEVTALVYETGGERLLDRIDLAISHPGISVMLGPNGAGKSLLLRLLHGLLQPTSGEIRWAGTRMCAALRRSQAMVFQKPVLLRRSVAANLDFVLRPRAPSSRQKRDRLLQQAGLAHKRDQPARLLSGGEQQKLALARALATEPGVLFLDEPCASIDSASTAAIEDRLKLCRDAGMKIVMITHDIGQARRLADEVLFLCHGRLLEHRPAAEFFDNPASPEARAYIDGRLVL